jgi:hypothetical protein
VNLDDMTWPPEAAGVGALLMTDPALPRDEFGHPYQPLFWFDDQSRTTGLVVDDDDHVLAWVNNADGNPAIELDQSCQRVPEAVEQAARHWWSKQRRS